MAYVSWELMGLVPAVFSVYGKWCGNVRCPSFDKCDMHFYKMTDSTKLGEITNQFEGQQVNYVLCWQNDNFFFRLAIKLSVMIFLLWKWCVLELNFLYRRNFVSAESLTLCAVLMTFLSYYHPTWQFGFIPEHSWWNCNFTSMEVRTYEEHLKCIFDKKKK